MVQRRQRPSPLGWPRSLTTLADGSRVNTGTYLGKIGNELPCGGSSSGAHVHFSLLSGNTPISVHDKKFGGWTFYEGSSAYAGYAERNGVRVNRGGQLTNYGPGSSPSGGQIVGTASGKCVDVNGSNTSNGAAVTLYTCNGGANQRWRHS